MSLRWLVVLVGLATACVSPATVECGDGTSCPAGTSCVSLTNPDTRVCATSEQIAACASSGDGDACTLAGVTASVCHGGACLPVVCGDSRVDPGEVCDDGNTTSGDGLCSADCLSNETCGNGIVDPTVVVAGTPRVNESCDDGNLISGDGCSSACSQERMTWTRIDAPLPALLEHAMAYDSARRRMVVYGGLWFDAQDDAQTQREVFEWTGSSWTHVPVTIAPSVRWDHVLAYDPTRQRMVLFGGNASLDGPGDLGDTWEWDGTLWQRMEPATSPPARSHAAMVYDGTRKKVVLFGGVHQASLVDDTWEWDGVNWQQVSTAVRPPARYGHVMVFDPERGVVVVAGGATDTTAAGDTWELEGSTWRNVTTAPAPAALFSEAGAAYDPINHRVIAYAGMSTSSAALDTGNAGTYAYDGTSWSDLGEATPGDRLHATLATDWTTGEVYMFGGEQNYTPTDTTWIWNGSSWNLATPFSMPTRTLAAVARDPQRGVVWLFGGHDDTKTDTATLVSFDGAVFRDHTAAGPSPRSLAGLAYDQANQQLVLFGGATTPVGSATLAQPQTWVFDGTQWTEKFPGNVPPARYGAGMVYDPRRKRTVMFGGFTDTGLAGDTWEWDGTNWSPVSGTGPSARGFPAMTFDEARDVVVLYNGYGLGLLNDVWTYDGAWTQVADTSPLVARILGMLAYEPGTRDLITFSGIIPNSVSLADTWSWNGASWHDVATNTFPAERVGAALFTAPDGVGVYMFGGIKNYDDIGVPTYNDVWRLRFDAEVRREICEANVDNDDDGLIGCADPDCWARCMPACAPTTTCDVTAPRCGDSVCNPALENCRNCASDCSCEARCGDGFCDASETATSCPGDCTP